MDITSLEAQSFGPYPMRVCREKVGEFLDATGGERKRWSESAPPGFMAVALFVVAPDLLSRLDGYSVIHGEQTFGWTQALDVERELDVTGTVIRVRERGGSYFVSFEMAVSDGQIEVATGTSLFLVGPSLAVPPESAGIPEIAVDERGLPGPDQKSASRSDLVRYAAATRDWNPIHWDHGAATSAGLSGVVVHGLLQASWALEAAAHEIDSDRPFASAKVRFRNPLYPATPVDVTATHGEGRVSVEVSDGSTQYLTAQVDLVVE